MRFTSVAVGDVIDEEDGLPKHESRFSEGTVATYTCERGFELLGPARRQCQVDGTWTPEGVPFCGEFFYFILTLQKRRVFAIIKKCNGYVAVLKNNISILICIANLFSIGFTIDRKVRIVISNEKKVLKNYIGIGCLGIEFIIY